MNAIHSAPAATRAPGNPVRRRPVTTFVALAFGIGWPAVTLPLLAGLPPDPFLLLLVFAGLLAPALVVTRMTDGPGAIRKLLSRATMWKFGATRWVMILLAVPTLTVAIAAVSGTLTVPEGGIPAEAGMYLFRTLIFGALVLNLWEETAWGGFAQTRLMARHGLLIGSVLTAPLFAAIHLPLLFAEGWTWVDVGTGFALLLVAAPFYRYLLGLHLLRTGGSILAIGVQHAAWNASGNIDGVNGEWQSIVAVALLTVVLAVLHRRSGRTSASPVGTEEEKAAAASWTRVTP
ncbi:MAG TPA: CPBP family intramembrane glutamic endopeptidase [Propionicimonas sp.]|nr:CPBP family intramembrane glutamic endopeptidase [Propionicimonas sp.]